MDRYNIVKGFLGSAELDLVFEWAETAPDRFIAARYIVEPGELGVESLRLECVAEYLTDEQKRDIFYNNAARFLDLTEEEIARHHSL